MASDDDKNSSSTSNNNNNNITGSSGQNNKKIYNGNNSSSSPSIDDSIFTSPLPGRVLPEDLRKVLIDFSVACLVNEPSDYIDYGVKYFRAVQEKRHSNKRNLRNIPIPSTLSLVKVNSKYFGKHERKIISKASLTLEDSNEDIDEGEIGEPVRDERNFRRKSVYAASYDPEEDADDWEDHEDDEDIEMERCPKTDVQRQKIKAALERVFMFRKIDDKQINQAIKAMWSKTVEAGTLIIRRNTNSDQNFYVVENGKFNAYVNGKYAYSYDNEGYFGELALLYNTETDVTIKAGTDGVLWVMNGPTFQRILLKNSLKKRRMYEALLGNVPLLKVLKQKELLNLADALIPQRYQKGEVIIKQGDVGNGMYFIEEGQVAVKIEWKKGEGEQYVASLQRGAYFGEIALLTNGPRMASIYAETDAKLAFLEKEGFERLLGKCINLLKRGLKEYENVNLKPYLEKLDKEDVDTE